MAEMLSLDSINAIVNRAYGNESVAIVSHSLKLLSSKITGYLGSHHSLEITVKRTQDGDTDVRHYFVKTVPQTDGHQSTFIKERDLFGQESAYFNVLLPLLGKDFVGQDWCPKCSLANREAIVLEDMGRKGFSAYGNKILDAEHLKAAARAQARLHAASILTEARLGQSLATVSPDACVEQVFRDDVLQCIDLLVDMTHRVARELGCDDPDFEALLRKGFARMQSGGAEEGARLGRVICHGDTWRNNYLFRESDSAGLECVMVDFQFVRYASQAYDLIQLVQLNTDREARAGVERAVVEAYHEELCDTLARNDASLPIPSLVDLLEEYEDLRPSALFAAALYYPSIYVDHELLADLTLDEIHEKLFGRSNNDFLMQLYRKDEFYAGVLNGLALDLIECQSTLSRRSLH